MQIPKQRFDHLHAIVTQQREQLLAAKDEHEDEIDENRELEEAVYCREEALIALEEALHYLSGESDDLPLLEWDIAAIFSAHYLEI